MHLFSKKIKLTPDFPLPHANALVAIGLRALILGHMHLPRHHKISFVPETDRTNAATYHFLSPSPHQSGRAFHSLPQFFFSRRSTISLILTNTQASCGGQPANQDQIPRRGGGGSIRLAHATRCVRPTNWRQCDLRGRSRPEPCGRAIARERG